MITARFAWDEPPDGGRYTDYLRRVKEGMLRLAQTYAAQLRSHAQRTRPWTDRTSNARQRLMAKAQWEGNVLIFYLFHQMFYGVFLELRWNGRYAVLMPTLRHFFNRILRALNAIWMGH